MFIGAFLSLLVLVFILVAGNALRDKLTQFMEGQFSLKFMLEMLGLLLPYAVKYALPPALLTGILLGLGRLSADSEITAIYYKKKFKFDEIINTVKENAEIIDISTDDGDLEDIFVELTNN